MIEVSYYIEEFTPMGACPGCQELLMESEMEHGLCENCCDNDDDEEDFICSPCAIIAEVICACGNYKKIHFDLCYDCTQS